MNFQGKTALITGASSGIGEEFARQLYAKGCRVILVARRAERLQKLASELKQSIELGCVESLVADLTNRSDLEMVQRYTINNQIDILVNNAGFGSFGPFERSPLSHELDMVQLNISATIYLLHSVIPQMKERRNGAIISISSVAGFQPLPYMATYSATKAFNLWHSLALRQELSDFGVRVLTVCPGPTETEFFGAFQSGGASASLQRDTVSAVVAEGIRALERNKGHVATGMRSKLMAFFGKILPYSFTTWVMKRYFRLPSHK